MRKCTVEPRADGGVVHVPTNSYTHSIVNVLVVPDASLRALSELVEVVRKARLRVVVRGIRFEEHAPIPLAALGMDEPS